MSDDMAAFRSCSFPPPSVPRWIDRPTHGSSVASPRQLIPARHVTRTHEPLLLPVIAQKNDYDNDDLALTTNDARRRDLVKPSPPLPAETPPRPTDGTRQSSRCRTHASRSSTWRPHRTLLSAPVGLGKWRSVPVYRRLGFVTFCAGGPRIIRVQTNDTVNTL
eukprot:GHVU01016976.1.p1 GENE.GHVU01016976.1~~GHVU01016976.1.p1  ORF type:complete len:163 (+),score=10.26 GHVU01016976.1:491-979(+)